VVFPERGSVLDEQLSGLRLLLGEPRLVLVLTSSLFLAKHDLRAVCSMILMTSSSQRSLLRLVWFGVDQSHWLPPFTPKYPTVVVTK
jgi:hypothetical protein